MRKGKFPDKVATMPLCVFDIFPDGSAVAPDDDAPTGKGVYRWWHFDLADPELAAWTAAHLPDIPAGALLQTETRPRCDPFENGLIVNLRGVNLNEGQPADQMVSVRLWMTADMIVTVRVRRVFALEKMRAMAEANAAPTSTAEFLGALIKILTERVQDEVTKLADLTDFYESDLEDTTTETPTDLPAARRSVIKLRRYLHPQQSALRALTGMDSTLIPIAQGHVLRELANRTTLAVEELDALGERIATVQDEHDLMVAKRQANHGYRLSLAAGIFLPLGFLTGLFGVNIGGMPGLENPWAFGLLCLTMIAIALVAWVALKKARWL